MKLNISAVIAHIVGWIVIIMGIMLGRVGFGPYISVSSVLITIFGAGAATIIAAPTGLIKNISKIVKLPLMLSDYNNVETIDLLVNLADRARRDGLLALEDTIVDIPEEFLRKGLQMVIDGTEPDIIKRTLAIQIEEMQSRHEQVYGAVENFGRFTPAFGMIGTVIGLVALLGNIGGEPAAIGRGMQTALITTLYGAVIANLVALPASARLQEMDVEEARYYTIILEGITAIQAGDNPRVLRDRLLFFVSGEERLAAGSNE